MNVRSLNYGDWNVLQSRMGDGATERDWRAWLIACSVWMINGEIILGDRSAPRIVYKTVRSLPRSALGALYYNVMGLVHRFHEAADLIEAFSYETTSRQLWKQVGLRYREASGIPGSDTLGNNALQQVWVLINTLEDDRLDKLHAWECAKLIASTHAYKAVRRMSQSEQTHLDYERQRRQEVMDRAYWKSKGYLVDTPEFKSANQMLRVKSADELMDEYKRWVSGEQDWHDQVVAEYKGKIKAAMLAEADRIRRINEEYNREIQALGLPESTPGIVGYTADQVQEILERAHRPGAMRGARQIKNDDQKFRNFERFLAPKEIPSNLSVADVFRSKSDGPSLDERIANRQVKLDPRERK